MCVGHPRYSQLKLFVLPSRNNIWFMKLTETYNEVVSVSGINKNFVLLDSNLDVQRESDHK